MTLQLRGDVLVFDGHDVGRISPTVSGSLRADLEDSLKAEDGAALARLRRDFSDNLKQHAEAGLVSVDEALKSYDDAVENE